MSPHAFSLRGGGNSEGVVFKEFSLPRFLAEEDVKPGSQNGYCASRTSLDTFQEGQAVASGTMFSVTALEDIEIQAFEFLSAAFINEQQVEIYTRAGGEYVSVSSKPDQWDLVSTTVGIDSADKLWTMAPRADMTSKINMKKGDSRSFYFTLKSQNLKLLATDNKVRDDLYVEDGRLQINVGVGLRFYPFPQLVDQDRAFQGRIHYQTTDKPCDEWMEESTTTMSFAVNSTARIQDVNVALTKELKDSLENAAILSRLKTVHGLELEDINPQPKDVGESISMKYLAVSL